MGACIWNSRMAGTVLKTNPRQPILQEIQMGPGDIGVFIALIGILAGIGVLAGAFAGAYFFGKSRGQRETLNAGRDP